MEDKLKIPRLASGKPKKNVNESECKEWTSTTGKKWGSTGSWKADPTGCISDGTSVWYNERETSHLCGYRGYQCVESEI